MRILSHLRHPRLRTKLLMSVVLAACVAMAVQFGISYQRVEANLGAIEAKRMDEDLKVVDGALNRLRFNLEQAVTGLAVSEELAAAVARGDRGWLDGHVTRRLARTFAAQSVTVYDEESRPLAVSGLTLTDLPRDTLVTQAQVGVVVSKYVYCGGGLWLAASAPIVAADDDTDVRGVLVIAQLVDGAFAGVVKSLVKNEVTFFVRRRVLATTDASLAAELERPAAVETFMAGRGLVLTSQHASAGIYLGAEGTEGLIVVSNVRAPIAAAQGALRRAMLWALVPALTVACLVALFLSVQLGRPLRSLRSAVTAIAFGDLGHRVEVGGDDEIADLGRAFNAMAERVASAQETLRRAAVRDSLTGLLNHREFYRRMTDEIARCERGGLPLAVMMIDVDYFKTINDTYGHLRGDAVLREVASAITACVREGDVVARYAGDEFAVILPGTAEREALAVAERLRACVRRVVATVDLPAEEELTLSIGIATRWPGEHTATRTVELADSALYRAKQGGRDRVEISDDVTV